MDKRLTPAEMKEIDCANFLVNTFGMLDKHIDTDFEAIDKNGDGVVSKEESERSERMLFLTTKLAPLKKTNEIFQPKAFRAKNVFCYLDNPSL